MFTATTWLVGGLLLILSEFIIPGFWILFFGVGGILTGLLLLCFAQIPVWAQLLFFTLTSTALLFMLRHFLPNIFGGREGDSELPPDDEEFAGKIATVIEAIVPEIGGKVTFQGTEWHAISEKRHEAGEHVHILRRDNITLRVE